EAARQERDLLAAGERTENALLAPRGVVDADRGGLGSEQEQQGRRRADEAEHADGRGRAKPAEPREPRAIRGRQELDDEEVGREAGEEDAREVPVADEAAEREPRASVA